MSCLTISSPEDDDLIDAINTAFKLSAERFENDVRHEVIAYKAYNR